MKIKKMLVAFVLVCLILCANISVFSKDIALDVLDGKHDYQIFATISDIDDEYITADFYSTLNKTEDDIPSSIKIEKFKYTYCSEHSDNFNNPKIGDNIFAVVDKSGENYKCSVAYKTDTVDTKTLSIYAPSGMADRNCMIDVIAVAYYIRSDGAYPSFVFTDDTLSVVLKDEEVPLYPTDSKTPLAVKYVTGDGKPLNQEEQQDVIAVNPTPNQTMKFYREMLLGRRIVSLGIMFCGVIIGMIVVYLVSAKRKKN